MGCACEMKKMQRCICSFPGPDTSRACGRRGVVDQIGVQKSGRGA